MLFALCAATRAPLAPEVKLELVMLLARFPDRWGDGMSSAMCYDICVIEFWLLYFSFWGLCALYI